MTTDEETPIAPPEGEETVSDNQADAETKESSETTLDPKEEARRRSKEDLARKRRGLHNRGGKL